MRKIIQISCNERVLYALCNDGTLWWWDVFDETWNKMPEISEED